MKLSKTGQTIDVDEEITSALAQAKIDFICGVPCSLLAGVIKNLEEAKEIEYVPVTREEEGVGVCAGAYLGGKKPALLLQNSGLGNSMNALLSLTRFYGISLVLLIGYRGKKGEPIKAQRPMGSATESLLRMIPASRMVVGNRQAINKIPRFATAAFHDEKIAAILFPPQLWGPR